jgi:hypothetical protein
VSDGEEWHRHITALGSVTQAPQRGTFVQGDVIGRGPPLRLPPTQIAELDQAPVRSRSETGRGDLTGFTFCS